MTRIGIYYYPWYRADRWCQHSRLFTPSVGEYDSGNSTLINYHVRLLKKMCIDYVVIELLPVDDWDYEESFEATQKFIKVINQHGIGFTFLVDTAVEADSNKYSVSALRKTLNELKINQIEPTVLAKSKKLIFFFSTPMDRADKIRREIEEEYLALFPLYLPNWATVDDNADELLKKAGCQAHFPLSRSQSLPLLGYTGFWFPTAHIQAMNGFVPVIPGYDDLLLERNPQIAPTVPRNNGHTLVEQFEHAVESGAGDILLYGWNEYFEATTIEPTLEYGSFYTELTGQLIHQVKRGDPIHFPENLGEPKPMPPHYLTPALERAAQRHLDKVPRWDQDNYVSHIEVLESLKTSAKHIIFPRVRVTNIGIEPWKIETKHLPIRLGLKIYNTEGSLVREGRAELGRHDIEVSGCWETEIRLDILGLPADKYRAILDVVWENKRWFHSGETLHFSLGE